jgi:hypothetical protein
MSQVIANRGVALVDRARVAIIDATGHNRFFVTSYLELLKRH